MSDDVLSPMELLTWAVSMLSVPAGGGLRRALIVRTRVIGLFQRVANSFASKRFIGESGYDVHVYMVDGLSPTRPTFQPTL